MNDMRGERLQVMLSPEELAAVDDFRFKHRMPTRAAAVRELLRFGLQANRRRWQRRHEIQQLRRLQPRTGRPYP